MRLRRPSAVVLPLVAVALLTSCAEPAQRSGGAPSAVAEPSTVAPTTAAGPGGATDVCALVPTAELQAVLGAEPPAGRPGRGKIDGGRCTWTVSGGRTVLAQYTRQPDSYLPAGVWKEPTGATDLPGVDRGWVSARSHTILVVEGGRGLLLTDVGLGEDDPDAFLALGRAIAARL